jgi:hypothetical protein
MTTNATIPLAFATLPAPYLPLRPLGQGGQGQTWLVLDQRDGTQAVAKIGPQPVLQREAAALAQIAHPAIPALRDLVALPGGQAALISAYIAGEALDLVVERSGPQSVALVRRWAVQIGAALVVLHGCTPPLIHRDIKPANLILRPDGSLALVDFGIARSYVPGQAQDTTIMASAGYAPPEQYGRAQTDARSDLYGLAATLVTALTGHDMATTPFVAPSLAHLPDRDLVALLLAALDMEPRQRPQSAQAWLAALGESVPTMPAPGPPIPAADGSLLLPIPGGPFRTGPAGTLATLPPFQIAQLPVTVGQWRAYRANGGSGPDPAATLAADLPMTGISQIAAERYAHTFGLRLPTALEWERAARGGDDRRYPWGPIWDSMHAICHPATGSAPVAAHRGRSAAGVADMIGNVWEWTATRTGLSATACGGCWRNEGAALACWSGSRFPCDIGDPTVGVRVAQ